MLKKMRVKICGWYNELFLNKKKAKEWKILRGKINVKGELSIFLCWKLVYGHSFHCSCRKKRRIRLRSLKLNNLHILLERKNMLKKMRMKICGWSVGWYKMNFFLKKKRSKNAESEKF